jgi:hypothetical protein
MRSAGVLGLHLGTFFMLEGLRKLTKAIHDLQNKSQNNDDS